MTEEEARARINLALSLLNQRPADEHTVHIAGMALRGYRVADIANWERHVHLGAA